MLVNIDKTNENEYHELNQYLSNRYYKNKNIFLLPGFVEKDFQCCFNRERIMKFYIEQYEKYGVSDLTYYPFQTRIECMARQINSFMIDPNGNLFKCWNDLGKNEKCIGNINKKIGLNSEVAIRYFNAADQLENSNCKKCTLFPVCNYCPSKGIDNLYNNARNDLCDIRKDNLKLFLNIHYKIMKQLKYT